MAKKPLRLVTVIEPDGTITVTQEPNPNYDRLSKAVGGVYTRGTCLCQLQWD